jgi:hypothetical protein
MSAAAADTKLLYSLINRLGEKASRSWNRADGPVLIDVPPLVAPYHRQVPRRVPKRPVGTAKCKLYLSSVGVAAAGYRQVPDHAFGEYSKGKNLTECFR